MERVQMTMPTQTSEPGLMKSRRKHVVVAVLLIMVLFGLLVQGCLLQDDSVDPDASGCSAKMPAIRLGEPWVHRESATTRYLRRIVWAGSRFVVTMEADSVLVSENGVSWSKHAIPKGLNAVAWSGNRDCQTSPTGVIVGVGGNGAVLSSVDGKIWTERVSGINNRLWEVEWTRNQFVAVGDGGTILTSPDGASWTSRTSGTDGSLYDVAWNDSVIVVAGSVLLSSTDGGITWVKRDTQGEDAKGLSWVSWLGSAFVARNPGQVPISSGYSLRSPDGFVWTRVPPVWGFADKNNLIGTQTVALGGTSDVVDEAIISVFPPAEGDSIMQQGLGVYFMAADVAWNGTRLVVVGSGGTIMTMP